MIIGIKPITMNGSINIPEKFKLKGKTIIVIVDDDFCEENNCFGEADFTQHCITLCNRYHGKKLTKKFKEITYYHELVHMILYSLGYDKLKYDEDLVEGFAQRLYEYEKSKQ